MATADRETTDHVPDLTRDPSQQKLPNARVNPLLNPLLAKHLGRWAHIYYTASVDKREAAVEKLVLELEAEEARLRGANPVSQNPSAVPLAPPEPAPSPARNARPMLVSSEGPKPASEAWPGVATSTARVVKNELPGAGLPSADTRSTDLPDELPFGTTEAAPIPASWQELVRRSVDNSWPLTQPSSGPQSERLPAEASSATEPETVPSYVPEIDSRSSVEDYRSFDDLLAKSAAAEPEFVALQRAPAHGLRMALVGAAALVILGGAFWVMRGRPSRPAAITPTAAAKPSSTPQPPAAAPSSSVPAAHAPLPPAPAPQPPAAVAPIVNAASQSGGSSVPSSQIPPAADPAAPPDPELAAGIRALQGKGVPRDSAEAARHFWQSVKNQNSSALVLLAGLYAQGDGVAKDCDQAKILFGAASRQAKSHIQLQRLEMTRETLRTSGCE